MKLNGLKKNPGATHRRKVVGRGPGSGHGKTSGRGENGQKSRSGSSIPATFEGGQNPFYRRVSKRGFNNKRFTKRYAVVNVSDFNRFDEGTEVTPELLKSKGLVRKELNGIKVLGSGEISKKLTIKANIFTNQAIEKIEKLGGKAEVI